jgi:Cu/Ag efflux pump CusA
MAAVLAEVQAKVPGVQVELAQLMEDLIGDLTAVPQPIEIKLYATDPSALIPQAEKVAAAISKIDGVVEVKSGVKLAGDALDLRIDPVRAGIEGVTPDDISRAVDAALTGVVATQLPQATKTVGVRVHLPAGCIADAAGGAGRPAYTRVGRARLPLAPRCQPGAGHRPTGNLPRQSAADDRGHRAD